MKTIFLILIFACCSLYASAQQTQIVTDTSKGLSTATRAILHYQFLAPANMYVEFNNGCVINLKTVLNLDYSKQTLNFQYPNHTSTDSQNMLKILDYMEEKGFRFVGTFYQIDSSFGIQAGAYVLEKK